MAKFKPIGKGETLTLENGYMTNGKWCFLADWLEAYPNAENGQIRARIHETKLALVEARLAGRDVPRKGVAEVVRAVDLKQFRAVQVSEARKHLGYKRGRPDDRSTVAMVLAPKIAVDVEFFPALAWDPETSVLVRDEKSPVVLVKGGQIVGLLSPMKI